jgi:hypothetical protein
VGKIQEMMGDDRMEEGRGAVSGGNKWNEF